MSDPYAEQQQLVGLLEAAHANNAAILERHGYPCSTRPGGYRPSAAIAEPEARAAAEIIDAVGNVWRALFGEDKAALANAALWLGVLVGPDGLRALMAAARKAGGDTRGKQQTAARDATCAWLWPLLWESDQELIAEGRPRGHEPLATEATLRLMPDDPRRGLVTERRIKAWIRAGRPPPD